MSFCFKTSRCSWSVKSTRTVRWVSTSMIVIWCRPKNCGLRRKKNFTPTTAQAGKRGQPGQFGQHHFKGLQELQSTRLPKTLRLHQASAILRILCSEPRTLGTRTNGFTGALKLPRSDACYSPNDNKPRWQSRMTPKIRSKKETSLNRVSWATCGYSTASSSINSAGSPSRLSGISIGGWVSCQRATTSLIFGSSK